MRATAAAHLGRLRLHARWWPVPYAALTAVLFLEQDARQQGLTVLGAVLLVALCVPLAWQRDRPLEAFVAAMVLYVITAASPVDTSALTAVFLVIFGPLFCVGRFEPPRRGLVGLLAAVVALPISAALEPPFDPSIFVTIPFFVLPAYLVGRVVRSRSGLVAELAEVNATIEREQAEAEAGRGRGGARAGRPRAARRGRPRAERHGASRQPGRGWRWSAGPRPPSGALAVVEAGGHGGDGGDAAGCSASCATTRTAPAAGLVRLEQIWPRAPARPACASTSRSTPATRLAAGDDRPRRLPHRPGGGDQRRQARGTDATRRLCGRASTPASLEVLVEDDGRPDGARTRRGHRPRPARACASASRCTAASSRPAAATSGGFRVCAQAARRVSDAAASCSSTTRRSCAPASALILDAAAGHRGGRRGRRRRRRRSRWPRELAARRRPDGRPHARASTASRPRARSAAPPAAPRVLILTTFDLDDVRLRGAARRARAASCSRTPRRTSWSAAIRMVAARRGAARRRRSPAG